jgi:DNA-binding transcriptional LysR family regulator
MATGAPRMPIQLGLHTSTNMNPAQIDLNLFTVFDAIYRSGGITAASKQLHLSQPAVSHALARLRDLLGDPLFLRRGHAMIPTARARVLAGTIALSLTNLQRIAQQSLPFDPQSAHRDFVIALRQQHEALFLPRMFARLDAERAAGIGLATVRIARRTFEDDLRSGELDAAIDVELSTSPDIQRELLGRQSLCVVARRDHPQIRGGLDLATYFALEHILITGRRHGSGFEDAALSRLGPPRRIRIRCQQHAAACALVQRSDMIATMPRDQAELLSPDFDHQVLAFPAEVPELSAYLYWHASTTADPGSRWLRALVLSSWRAA